jgi:hypothetical protein
MTARALEFTARPTLGQLLLTRLRLYLRTGTGLQWTVGGLVGPPGLWALWHALTEQPWPESSNFVFFVPPALALAFAAASVFYGIRSPQTQRYLREGVAYAVSEDILEIRSALIQARVRWDAFASADEFSDLFLLRVGNELHLLPKANLPVGGSEELRALLRDRLGKRARLQEA